MKEGIEEAGTKYTCDSMTMRLRSLQASLPCTTSRSSMAPSTESKAVVSGVFHAALPFTSSVYLLLSIFIPLCPLLLFHLHSFPLPS